MSLKKGDFVKGIASIITIPFRRYSRINSDTGHELVNIDLQTTPRLSHQQRELRRGLPGLRNLLLVIAALLLLWNGLLVLLIYIVQVGWSYSFGYNDEFASGCSTDGHFYVGEGSMNLWSITGIFQINLVFGTLSFSNAKLIDVIWDVIIGRGGQSVLGYVTYKIATQALTRCMESGPVTYNTFIAITMQPSSIEGGFNLLRDYFRNSTTRTRATIAWVLLSFSFVLSFPTLISAMTGYTPNTDAYIVLNTGQQANWSDFRTVYYIIQDASRIGLYDNLLLSNVPDQDTSNPLLDDQCSIYSRAFNTSDCALRQAVSSYVWYWTLPAINGSENSVSYDMNSTFVIRNATGYNVTTIELGPPLLNITIYASSYRQLTQWEFIALNTSWSSYYDIQHDVEMIPFESVSRQDLYSFGNQTYDLDYLNNHGVCQQDNSFSWGFSYLLLFIVMLLLLIWLTAAITVWVDAYLCSFIDRTLRTVDLSSAAVELCHALDHKLKDEISVEYQIRRGGDSTLRKRLSERLAQPQMEHKKLGYTPEATMSRSDILQEWLTRKKYGGAIWRWRFWIMGLLIIVDFAIIASVWGVRIGQG